MTTTLRLGLWLARVLASLLLGYAATDFASAAEPDAQPGPHLVLTPAGHTQRVRALVATRDGRLAVTAGGDGAILVWDLAEGRIDTRFHLPFAADGGPAEVSSLAVSNDGRWLAAGGDSAIRLYDLPNRRRVATWQAHTGGVMSLDFSADGLWLVSGGFDRLVKLWSVETHELVRAFAGHAQGVHHVDLHLEGDVGRIVSADYAGHVKLWDWQKNTPGLFARGDAALATWPFHGKALGAGFTANGQLVIVPYLDGPVTCMDLQGHLTCVRGPILGESYAFTADGRWMAACGQPAPNAPPETLAGPLVCALDEKGVLRVVATYGGHGPGGAMYVAFRRQAKHLTVLSVGEMLSDLHEWAFDPGFSGGNHRERILGVAGRQAWNVGFVGERIGLTFDSALAAHGRVDHIYDPVARLLRSTTIAEETATAAAPVVPWKQALSPDGKTLVLTPEVSLAEGAKQHRRLVVTPSPYNRIGAVTFLASGDSAEYAVGSNDGTLRLYREERVIGSVRAHQAAILCLHVNAAGTRLITSARDQTIRVWALDRPAPDRCEPRLLVSLFAVPQNDSDDVAWIAWHSSGYYDASAHGESLISWQIDRGNDEDAEILPASAFRARFHRPRFIGALMATGDLAAAQATLAGPAGDLAAIVPPRIRWLAPETRAAVTDHTIAVLRLAIEHAPAGRCVLLRDGRRDHGGGLKEVAKATPSTLILEAEVTLEPGFNRFQVIATNDDAEIVSTPRFVLCDPPAAAPAQPTASGDGPPRLVVLTIAVGDYLDPRIHKLPMATRDGTAMAEIVAGQHSGLYSSFRHATLIDGKATRAEILAALTDLKQLAKPADTVVLHLSSHGGIDDNGQWYMPPVDADLGNPAATCLHAHDFTDALAALACRRVVVFIDACKSGAFAPAGVSQSTAAQARQANGELARELSSPGYGIVVFSASMSEQSATERPEWGHGAFTLALLEAVHGKRNGPVLPDANGNGTLELMELGLYLSERVRQLTGGKQLTTVSIPSTVSSFSLFDIVPAQVTPAAPAAPAAPTPPGLAAPAAGPSAPPAAPLAGDPIP
ncbi:MAG: caspase family protein [Planctomycetes bacterium]|nr:caspase family protein [Planctomycetota bacterium]